MTELTDNGWEISDFPVVCEPCLGENPYMRMTKQPFGKQCKVCSRPFTVFKWSPGKDMRYKRTEICQTCAKLKNICQSCALDLDLRLPIQYRDHALGMKDPIGKHDRNKEYFVRNAETAMTKNDGNASMAQYGKVGPIGREVLKRVSAMEPYQARARPQVCPFFLKSQCSRGLDCPFRHEKPSADELRAEDELNEQLPKNLLIPPEDPTIATLFLMGLPEDAQDTDIRTYFTTFGELKSVTIAQKSKAAFVTFQSRRAAENAAIVAAHGCIIKDQPIRVQWAKSKNGDKAAGPSASTAAKDSAQKKPVTVPPPPPGAEKIVYESQRATTADLLLDKD